MAETAVAPVAREVVHPYVTRTPDIQGGRPCIVGTRFPVRSVVGRGLVVMGTVRSAGSCTPIPGARLEWWQANPRGQYDDAHRATQAVDGEGRYRLETSVPGLYPGRPVHLHVKVSAPGHRALITQLYPKPEQTEISFDFVLRPQ